MVMQMNTSEIDEPIYDPESKDLVEKNVFTIFAHGQHILSKIRKIAEALDATVYPVDHDNRASQLNECNIRLQDITSVLTNTNIAVHAELRLLSNALSEWFILVRKEKAIYNTMNNFEYDPMRKTLIAEGWIPTFDLPVVQAALRHLSDTASGSSVPYMNDLRTGKCPPTFFRTNKFTEEFQVIIDSYGVAKYREINPAIIAIVTFPFLFAVMFGDIGHGAIMALVGGLMWKYERPLGKVRDEMFEMIYSGRYIVLLFGVFSMYDHLGDAVDVGIRD
jgi:V-type H+-transporting ATPase subunit a